MCQLLAPLPPCTVQHACHIVVPKGWHHLLREFGVDEAGALGMGNACLYSGTFEKKNLHSQDKKGQPRGEDLTDGILI